MNKIRKNVRSTLIILIFTGFLSTLCQNCALEKNKLNLFINLERKDLGRSSMLVLNFKEPHHASGLGAYTAERFHLHLLASQKVKVVSLYTLSPWYRLGDTEEQQLAVALEEARDKHYDYVMVGEIKEVFDGGIMQSRVTLKTRVLEVKTRTTILLAEHSQECKSKETSFPMSTDLSKRADSPLTMIDGMATALVKKLPKRKKPAL